LQWILEECRLVEAMGSFVVGEGVVLRGFSGVRSLKVARW
jgi:hypothetical protein